MDTRAPPRSAATWPERPGPRRHCHRGRRRRPRRRRRARARRPLGPDRRGAEQDRRALRYAPPARCCGPGRARRRVHPRPARGDAFAPEGRRFPTVDTRAQRVLFGGRLRAVDVFARRARPCRAPSKDLSFRAFLARQRLSPLSRALATMMVQGFDAADPRDASALASSRSGARRSPLSHAPAGRLSTAVEDSAVPVQLETEVRVCAGRAPALRSGTLREPWAASAPRAIVTLPLGVLQSDACRSRLH